MTHTRMAIVTEGEDDGQYVLKARGLKFDPKAEYPIHSGYNVAMTPIGMARNVRREAYGKITAEIPDELILRYSERDGDVGEPIVSFYIYANGVQEVGFEPSGSQRIYSCTLIAIARVPNEFYPTGANPGANVEAPKADSYEDIKKMINEADTLEEAIGYAIGAASVCWENPSGAGVFDSTRAAAISHTLLELVRGYVR